MLNTNVVRPPFGAQLCYVVTDWLQQPHGTEALTVMVSEGLASRGMKVRIFTLDFDPKTSVWTERLQRAGVRVSSFRLPIGRRSHAPQRLMARYIWLRVRRERPWLVFAPTNDPLVIRTLLAKPALAPPFFVHDPNEGGPKFPTYHPLWPAASRRLDGLSVHGESQRRAALAFLEPRCPVAAVWPASLPPAQFSERAPANNRPLRFGQLGRLHYQKGGEFAIAAFSQVLARGFDAEMHFFGDGEDRGRLEALARCLGVDDFVIFHGRYSWRDLDRIGDSIDVAVMPSIFEGFGLVMLEMMSRGRPVISADVGSSREVLECLGGGWVVPRADTAELAAAMAKCCADRQSVADRGREAIAVWRRNFTPDAMVDRFLRFWKECSSRQVQQQCIDPSFAA
jgi:glycosyltransferase involved in cell wall biosynthesis